MKCHRLNYQTGLVGCRDVMDQMPVFSTIDAIIQRCLGFFDMLELEAVFPSLFGQNDTHKLHECCPTQGHYYSETLILLKFILKVYVAPWPRNGLAFCPGCLVPCSLPLFQILYLANFMWKMFVNELWKLLKILILNYAEI